jgi:hypothetical protein
MLNRMKSEYKKNLPCCVCFETPTFGVFKLDCNRCNDGKVCGPCVAKLRLHGLSKHISMLTCPVCEQISTIPMFDVDSYLKKVVYGRRLRITFFILHCIASFCYLFVLLSFTSFVVWIYMQTASLVWYKT